MSELLVGPWDLKGWSKKDGDLDIRQFIEDVETGKYPYGRYVWKLDRLDPWYQQLKMDVEAGLYDRTLEAEERLRVVIRRHADANRNMPGFDSESVSRSFLKLGNLWTVMASLYSNDVPNDPFHMRRACKMGQYLIVHPEEGWRRMS